VFFCDFSRSFDAYGFDVSKCFILHFTATRNTVRTIITVRGVL